MRYEKDHVHTRRNCQRDPKFPSTHEKTIQVFHELGIVIQAIRALQRKTRRALAERIGEKGPLWSLPLSTLCSFSSPCYRSLSLPLFLFPVVFPRHPQPPLRTHTWESTAKQAMERLETIWNIVSCSSGCSPKTLTIMSATYRQDECCVEVKSIDST